MTYQRLLALQPLTLSQGDTGAALTFVSALETYILDASAMAELTESQQNYLYRLRGRWQARANGDDVRWLERGSRAGRPATGRTPRKKKITDVGSPLFESLMKKFGEL